MQRLEIKPPPRLLDVVEIRSTLAVPNYTFATFYGNPVRSGTQIEQRPKPPEAFVTQNPREVVDQRGGITPPMPSTTSPLISRAG